MTWVAFLILQGLIIWSGIKQEQRSGLWSWSKFAFALGFAALECLIVIGPIAPIKRSRPSPSLCS